MADEQYRWLDREAAERLLRGEPLETVDAETREQADRLAEALLALAATPPLNSAELPGEAAALAAFRMARTGTDAESALSGGEHRTRGAARSADAGLVRLGRPAQAGRRTSWGRPLRLGLAAALAAGMIGGVAVAAGTGVLPTPFGDREPAPAATVSAASTPRQPLLSPSPGVTGGRSGVPSPDGSAEGSAPGGTGRDEARGGGAASGQPDAEDTGVSGRSGDRRGSVLASCRDLRRGRQLDADRRRVLEDAARGSGRVKKYCQGVLGDAEGRSGADEESGGKTDKDKDKDKGDKGGRDDGKHHVVPGGHRGNADATPPAGFAPSSAPKPAKHVTAGETRAASDASSPSPGYSALSVPARS
ncbi:hypothetical protein [Streptomyces sp. NPDC005907]|uniref:hypothetical protein n=1 Tax=Streptomyces sp. NPDC005907 TaxID=3154571 RepID=UPI0033D0AC5E